MKMAVIRGTGSRPFKVVITCPTTSRMASRYRNTIIQPKTVTSNMRLPTPSSAKTPLKVPILLTVSAALTDMIVREAVTVA